jgi:hypothetical protein
MAKRSKSTEPAVKVELKSRRKPGSKNATSFKPGNPHRFQPGTSGNPVGKPKEHRLLSRSLRSLLSDRAPSEVTKALGLPVSASWAQCLARRLVHQAVRGDLDAVKLIGTLTEGVAPRGVALDAFDEARRDVTHVPPLFQVVFVESDGQGRPHPSTLEGQAQRALPSASE